MVYHMISIIPYGKVTTYGQIALLLGMPQCSRQVGHALHDAPEYFELPCHRVVNSKGRLVIGWQEQRILLKKEGVHFLESGNVDLKQSMWRCNASELGKGAAGLHEGGGKE